MILFFQNIYIFSFIFTWTLELNNIISVKKTISDCFSWFCFLVKFIITNQEEFFILFFWSYVLDCVVLTRIFLPFICFKVPIINLIFTVACLNNNCKVYVTGVVYFPLFEQGSLTFYHCISCSVNK